jgi:hypothetical protein
MCCQLLLTVLHTGNDNRGVSLLMCFALMRKRNSVLRPAYKQNTAQLLGSIDCSIIKLQVTV